MHQHAQADRHIKAAIAKLEGVRVAALKLHADTLGGGLLAGDGEHRFGGVNRRDLRTAARQLPRRPAGAGSDIEDSRAR